MVECAVVLSVWLLVVFTALDLGLAVFRNNTLSESARRLARQAIVHGSQSSPEATPWGPEDYTGTAADETEIAAAALSMLATMEPENVSIEVQWPDGGNDPDQRIHVSLTYEHQLLIPFARFGGPMQLRGDCVMRIVH